MYPKPVEVATALSVAVGLVQVGCSPYPPSTLQIVMALLRLSFLTAYLSDQVVAGFSTGASFHVIAALLKDIFGLRNLPQREGYGNMPMVRSSSGQVIPLSESV